MRLFKNVDIKDLGSILEKGILSMDACGNNNWEYGKRVDNATNVVYLFKPLPFKRNYFSQYGQALIECEVSDAAENEFVPNDWNRGRYIEYVVDEVKPQDIKAVYIPHEYQDQVTLSSDLIKYVDYISALDSTPNCKDNLDLGQFEFKQMEFVSQDVAVKLFKHIGYVTKTKVFAYNGKQVTLIKKYKITDQIKYSYRKLCYESHAYLTETSAHEDLENSCNVYRIVDNGVLYEASFRESDYEIMEKAFISLLNKTGKKLPKCWELIILDLTVWGDKD